MPNCMPSTNNMMPIYDLHSHSTASDGALSPRDLVARAAQQGVTTLALTDHDTTAGLAEAQQAADEFGLRFINGIELSVTWNHHCFHIVGLGINPHCPTLLDGIAGIQAIRRERVQKIAQRLEKKQIFGAYEAIMKIAGATGMITRSHFADFLVAHGHVDTEQEAFNRYLAQGKPAYVATTWADLAQAIAWIQQAGGVAVLAHPMRYKLTLNWLKRFLTAFKDGGGVGIEVVTGRYNPDEVKRTAQLAEKFALAASVGSDFHNPKYPWLELGRLAPLPTNSRPIWDLLPPSA
jgi:predicted metal-dependent phosphoesterase TrpH